MKIYAFGLVTFLLISCGGGGGGGSAPQNISVSLTSSADSAEVNSSIALTWSSTLATSCSASGAWSGTKGTSGSESVTVGVGGSNTFSLSCSATGANSGSASVTVNGLRYFDGKVFDGYIRGAEVFVDTNDNLTLDANEASVTTDNQGSFTKLLYNNGTLISIGGIDSDTGADLSKLTLVHKLEGYEASKLASPFTTLIAYMNDASTINAALGIDASINLLTTDPIPNLGEGIYDQMYEKGNQLTVLSYTLQNHSDAVDSNSELYFQAIADQLEESYAANQAAVDIEDTAFISNVINKVETARETTFSSDVKANLNTVLSATIPLLKVYADASTTSSVQRFAFSTLQNDVKDSTVIIGNASPTLLKYENNVFDYVATDQGIDEADINPNYNNAPVINSSANFDINENNTVIGNISVSDLDGDSLIYSVSGSEINISDSGQLTFVTAPDYETKNSYSATVTVSDGTDSVTQDITVLVYDVNDRAPVINSSHDFYINENNTFIGNILASDPDGDSLTYSISGSAINISDSGQLTFVAAPDYETKNSYSATITVSDGVNIVTQDIAVGVSDIFDSINISSSATFTAAENQTNIGSILTSDTDNNLFTYSISGFEINISNSGVLTFASAPDYEIKNAYSATVTISDGANSISQNITVNVIDIEQEAFLNKFTDNQGIDIILIYGQSNAAGNGDLNEQDTLKLDRSNLMYKKCANNSNDIFFTQNCGSFEIISEPSDIYNISEYSSWTTFSTNLEIYKRRQTVFINGAVGGTRISDLLKSGADKIIKGTSNRFTNLIWATEHVFKKYGRDNINSVSILFLQGESDVISMREDNLSRDDIINRFQKYFFDLNDLKKSLLSDLEIPEISFYLVRLGVPDGEAKDRMPFDLSNDLGYWQIKFTCEKSDFFPLSILPRTFSIEEGTMKDGIHYSRLGYDMIGEKGANAFNSYMSNSDISNSICQDNELFPPLTILEKPYD